MKAKSEYVRLVALMLCIGAIGLATVSCGSASSDPSAPLSHGSSSYPNDTSVVGGADRTVIKQRPRGPGVTQAVAWHAEPAKGSKSLTLLLPYSWCGGPRKPYVQRIKIVEKAPATIVTALVRIPSVNDGDRRSCLQTRILLRTRVLLGHEPFHSVLYDGSSKPPIRRWPREGP